MERTFIPEVAVGFFQIDLTAGAVVNFSDSWAAAQIVTPALQGIEAKQYIILLDVEGATVRFRNDGVDPTAAIGNRILKDTQFIYTAASRSTLRFLQETAGAKINVGVYRHSV